MAFLVFIEFTVFVACLFIVKVLKQNKRIESQIPWYLIHDITTCVKKRPSCATIIKPRREKSIFGVSEQARHKPGCTATKDGKMLEIADLGGRGIVLST